MTGTEYSEGYEARYYNGLSWQDNPYDEGTAEHNKWDDGYWDADMDLYDLDKYDTYDDEDEDDC